MHETLSQPLTPAQVEKLREEFLKLPLQELLRLEFFAKWKSAARSDQFKAATDNSWNTWLILSGRGWGKTRTGSQWLCDKALFKPKTPCAIVAPTHDLLLKVNFNGPSGVVTLLGGPSSKLIKSYVTSPSPLVTLYNGSTISGYSAQEPERLRGPEYEYALLDEWAAWQYMQMSYDMVKMCLRIGQPQMVITTTPKPLPILRRVMAEEGVIVTRGTTYDNKQNLAPKFFQEITKYDGTQIGKQEIYGEVLDFENSGIFQRRWFNIWPNRMRNGKELKFPHMKFIVQSYDTAFKEKQSNDPSACTTWGVFNPWEALDTTPPKGCPPFGLMLLDCWSERLLYPDLRAKMRKEYDELWTDEALRADIVLIEDKASGQALIPDLQRAGVPVEAYTLPPDSDKIQRAHAVSHLAKRCIWLPETKVIGQGINDPARKQWMGDQDPFLHKPQHARKWAQPFLDQVCIFGPAAFREMEKMRRKAVMDEVTDDITMHDDYVDSFTQVLAYLRDAEWLQLPSDLEGRPELPPPPTHSGVSTYG